MNTIVSEYKSNVLGNTDFLTSNFSIYPNPNKGAFSIEFKATGIDYKVTIVDALGRQVYKKEVNQSTDLIQNIQIDNAVAGLYFVSIQSNGSTLTKKIIIE
jgi:uncharacterized protein YxjI